MEIHEYYDQAYTIYSNFCGLHKNIDQNYFSYDMDNDRSSITIIALTEKINFEEIFKNQIDKN